MQKPKFHALLGASLTDEAGVYVATVDLTGADGIRKECLFVSRADDPVGLGPAVRGAIATWVTTGKPVEAYAPTVSMGEVLLERERRLAAGFHHDFGDARGVHRIGTTASDMAGWDEVTTIATARHANGSSVPIMIVIDTGPTQVTPAEWFAILEAAGDFRQPIWLASFALQEMDPIPADYADNGWRNNG